MATQDHVRRIALTFPGVREDKDHFAFSVASKGKDKGFAWVWLERVHPKKARVPQPKVLAVRVSDLSQKDMLIASDPDVYFTEPHYNGFPAVLVRLAAIRVAELEALLQGAWRCQPRRSCARSWTRRPRIPRVALARPGRRSRPPASARRARVDGLIPLLAWHDPCTATSAESTHAEEERMSIRSSMWIAIAGLTGALAVGGASACAALDEGEAFDEAIEEGEEGAVANSILAESIAVAEQDFTTGDERRGDPGAVKSAWCPEGWHEHVVVWPKVGRSNAPCGAHTSTIPLGRHVCMLNRPSAVCNGEGYAQVYLLETESPMNDWQWSRTEAFNGH
jgi:hypothetical protein